MPKNIYRNSKGEVLPGVTTIINQLDKPALIQWAWKLGKEGKDWKAERDSAGDIGALVHELIIAFLKGEQPNISDNEPTVVACVKKFLDWWATQKPKYEDNLIVEQPLVSEKLGFGGQPDLYIITDSGLKDIKTGGGIYDSCWIQLAGYDILLREHGYNPKSYQILWLPKDNRFDAPIRTDLRKEKKIFKHLLGIYQLRRE